MHCIYQIKRVPIARGYRFELVNELTGAVVVHGFGLTTVPPKWMRLAQAKLNTATVLERGAMQ